MKGLEIDIPTSLEDHLLDRDWIKQIKSGWELKELEDVCQTCTSPCCMQNKDKTLYEPIIQSAKEESDLCDTAKSARCIAYYRAVNPRYGSLGWNTRVRTRIFYVDAVEIKSKLVLLVRRR